MIESKPVTDAEITQLRAVADTADAYVSRVRSDKPGSYEQWLDLRAALTALKKGETK